MTDINSTTLYEALFRWEERTGAFRGAQLQRWRYVVMDGETVRDSEMPPEPITPDNVDAITEIVGGVNASALARIGELEVHLAAARARIDELEAISA